MPADSVHKAVGVIVEILPGYGLAQVMTDDKRLLAIRRVTPGVIFEDLRVGDQVEVEFLQPFSRVLRARVSRLAAHSTGQE